MGEVRLGVNRGTQPGNKSRGEREVGIVVMLSGRLGPLGLLTLGIGILVAARLALAVALWDPGWSALTWDDFLRVAIAQEWASDPRLAPDLVWLPFPIWVNGVAFAVFGDMVRANPMLLTAIVNTVASLATAGVVAWSAQRLARSVTGTLLAFGVVAFAPWGVFTSLSGLGEPLYYLAVAGAIAGTVGWIQTRRHRYLGAAAVCVALSAATRYEGWALFAAWAIVLFLREVGPIDRTIGTRLWRQRKTVAIIAAPSIVPILWMGISWARAGSPLHFATETARYFSSAYGAVHGLVPRVSYYPLSLLRAAPVLAVVLTIVVVIRRRDRVVTTLAAIVGVQLAMMYASSILSPVVGAFNERFMFAFVLALAPLAAHIPGVLRELRVPRAVTVGFLVAFVAVTAFRIEDRPTEWTHGPDLLALAEILGDLGSLNDPVQVALGPGTAFEATPLSVRSGGRVLVEGYAAGTTSDGLIDGSTIWVERLPARVQAIDETATLVVGRYFLYTDLPVAAPACPGCEGWIITDEAGLVREAPAGPYVALEFTGNDPLPGEQAVIRTTIAPATEERVASLEIRSLYGHGFNPGRMEMRVSLDGEAVLRRDIAEQSRWLDVAVPLPGDGEPHTLEVGVVALPDIEVGWEWGRQSTVLIRSLRVEGV